MYGSKADSFYSEVEAKFASLGGEVGSLRGDFIFCIDWLSDYQMQFYMTFREYKGEIEVMEKH